MSSSMKGIPLLYNNITVDGLMPLSGKVITVSNSQGYLQTIRMLLRSQEPFQNVVENQDGEKEQDDDIDAEPNAERCNDTTTRKNRMGLLRLGHRHLVPLVPNR